jgi:tetratricopeptide (TPR) repeat protein
VFDSTLRQGLAVQLDQSPFLNVISEERVRQTLSLMGKPTDTKLTPELARELCERAGATAALDGSIAQIGTQYLLTLEVVNCSNGESLARTEAQASDKSHILDGLGKAASDIRNKLGESLTSVQKFDTPLQQATTPSLEALQSFSLGWRTVEETGHSGSSIPFFERSVKLDPNFAAAYAVLGTIYSNLGENRLASDNLRKAYGLRDHVSQRERLFIEAQYHNLVTGDLEKAQQVLQVYAQTYPRDGVARNRLGNVFAMLGQNEKSLTELRESLRLNPDSGFEYNNVVCAYMGLNRLEEARATAEEAQAKKLEISDSLYILGFLQNDGAAMKQQVAVNIGKLGVEDGLLGYEADTSAYFGQLGNARAFSDRAVAAAERAKEHEVAASYDAEAALREALFGNAAEARHR